MADQHTPAWRNGARPMRGPPRSWGPAFGLAPSVGYAGYLAESYPPRTRRGELGTTIQVAVVLGELTNMNS
jgi:hypothetical protein